MADTYQVGIQTSHEIINPAGTGFLKVWDVPYTITSGPGEGTGGTVTVQERDHNAVYVDQAIRAKIAHIQDIAGLGSTPLS